MPVSAIGEGTRVLLLNQYFPPDSASTGRYAATIAARLAAEGFDVTAIVAQPSYGSDLPLAAEREDVDGMVVVRVPLGRRRGRQTLRRRVIGYLTYLVRAWWMSRAYRPDVVLAFHNPPLIGVVAALAARRSRGRCLLVVFDIHPDILQATGWTRLPEVAYSLWDRMNRAVLARAWRVIVLGDGMKRTLVEGKGLEANRVQVIPLWPEPALDPTPPDLDRRDELGIEGDLMVLYAGNMGVMQPLETVFDAMAGLAGRSVSLILLGDGVRRAEWERRARELGDCRIRFLGFVPDAEFERTVAAADVALVTLAPGMERLSVPSRSYTFLSAGRSIVALMDRDSDVAALLRAHECGWSVRSAGELGDVLARLEQDRTLARDAGVRARRAYEAHHDPQALTYAYAEVVAEAARAGADASWS